MTLKITIETANPRQLDKAVLKIAKALDAQRTEYFWQFKDRPCSIGEGASPYFDLVQIYQPQDIFGPTGFQE